MCAGSPHARVATAAAGALSAAAATCGPTLEPHLDRFMAALFGAAVSPRQEAANAAGTALAGEILTGQAYVTLLVCGSSSSIAC